MGGLVGFLLLAQAGDVEAGRLLHVRTGLLFTRRRTPLIGGLVFPVFFARRRGRLPQPCHYHRRGASGAFADDGQAAQRHFRDEEPPGPPAAGGGHAGTRRSPPDAGGARIAAGEVITRAPATSTRWERPPQPRPEAASSGEYGTATAGGPAPPPPPCRRASTVTRYPPGSSTVRRPS